MTWPLRCTTTNTSLLVGIHIQWALISCLINRPTVYERISDEDGLVEPLQAPCHKLPMEVHNNDGHLHKIFPHVHDGGEAPIVRTELDTQQEKSKQTLPAEETCVSSRVVCWGSSFMAPDRKRLDKLMKNSSSISVWHRLSRGGGRKVDHS